LTEQADLRYINDCEMPKARIGRFSKFKTDEVDALVAAGKADIKPSADDMGDA
jgi:hypothetical protein